ncbi:MAG: PAS domain S-box protein [Rhodanobacteraceae bacterium]|nr:PAS domain S-box protein [Rhodanobacteraceae bacterium]
MSPALRPNGWLEALADAAPDAMLVIDAEGTIQFANLAVQTVFHYEPEELLGQKIEKLVPSRYHTRHRADRARYSHDARSRPMGLNLELLGVRRDGSEFPVEVSLSPMRSGDTHFVIAAVRDVTELRRSRELLQRSARQLALASLAERAVTSSDIESFCKHTLSVLIEQLQISHGGLCERGHDGHHVRFISVTGWTDEEALPVILKALSPARMRRMLEGQVRQILVVPSRAARARLDQFLAGVIVPLRGPTRVHGVLSIFRSAEQPLSEDECVFAQSAAHLAAAVFERQYHQALLLQASKMEALGQLTGGVAHDFNNLLTVIGGNLQILDDLLPAAQTDIRSLVDAASRASRRAAELTGKLLAFSRKRQLAAQAVDCSQLLNSMRELLRRTLGEGIELRYRIAPDLQHALADAGQLESAVLNLALNARDAMPNGGTLTLSALQRNRTRLASRGADTIVIEISDSGEGMTKEVREHALEPFFTTKASGKGTGLGLSMVYGFVRQWGGDVRIYSEPGMGTTVRMMLPAAHSGESAPVLASKGMRTRGDEHVLVVEDDPEVAAIACNQLRSLGYRVSMVNAIAPALALIQSAPDIALVFSDVVLLGGETGFQLADQVRLTHPHLPILFCSGYAEGALEQHFADGERPAILAKPYAREDLGSAVRELIDAPGRRR